MQDSKDKLSAILAKIKGLEDLLQIHILSKRLDALENQIKSLTSGDKAEAAVKTSESGPDLSDALDALEEVTTSQKTASGSRLFLLHRPTENFEYQNAAEGVDYKTEGVTEWMPEVEAAEFNQQKKNPVVSCWVPEEAIADITGAEENTGTWGDLGTNPHTTKFKIKVKAGSYKIHTELRQ